MYTEINNESKNKKNKKISYKILDLFAHGRKEITTKDVCMYFDLSPSYASNLMYELQRRRWVRRKRNPMVKYGYIYRLNKKGSKKIKEMKAK